MIDVNPIDWLKMPPLTYQPGLQMLLAGLQCSWEKAREIGTVWIGTTPIGVRFTIRVAQLTTGLPIGYLLTCSMASLVPHKLYDTVEQAQQDAHGYYRALVATAVKEAAPAA